MKEEITFSRSKTCEAGHNVLQKVKRISVDEDIIRTKGIEALSESLILHSSYKCSISNCSRQIKDVKIDFNVQIYIELEIMISSQTLMTCSPKDFPIYLNFDNNTFR